MVPILFLGCLCNLGEEQSIRLRHYLSHLKGLRDVLDRCGCIGFIHICLIHQERYIAVMGQGKRHILLGVIALVPATTSAVVLISGSGHLSEVESLRIQPFHVTGYKRGG